MNDHDELPLFKKLGEKPMEASPITEPSKDGGSEFGKYIVYVDESGDHSLQSIDSQYPVFVLAFCVFHKMHYSDHVVPALEKFKFKHFGHDQIVLHENEIRKEKGVFRIFATKERKGQFMDELTGIIEHSNFILISSVINKVNLHELNGVQENPYHIALRFCLETLYDFLEEKHEQNRITHIVFEKRGNKEDKDLELEFLRVCAGQNTGGQRLPFEILFSDKKAMSSGLQLADLVARPIGLHVLRKGQKNRAFDILKRKFYCEGGRLQIGKNYEQWGLKIYPG